MHAWVMVDVVWAGILPSVDKKDHVILMYKSKLLLLPFSSDPESVTVIKIMSTDYSMGSLKTEPGSTFSSRPFQTSSLLGLPGPYFAWFLLRW